MSGDELARCRTVAEVELAVRGWVTANVPPHWRAAGDHGGPAAVRAVRTTEEYREWYPVFGRSGLVAAGWPLPTGGLAWDKSLVSAAERVLAPYHLPRLNPLGLHLAAPALFAHGSEQQQHRYLPRIVTGEEIWCQLFSEPGAGSDLASLSTRAEREGDHWVVTGQKVWTTWAHLADFAVLLARTDPDAPKRQGLTYFLIEMRQPGVEVRPLRHLGGEVDFNEVFLSEAVVPDAQRVGEVNAGWQVARATLSGERQMVSGVGSGGVDRIGGASTRRLIALARDRADHGLPMSWAEPSVRAALVRLWCDEQVRRWTNNRIRASVQAGLAPGPESSVGKVHGSELNQRLQMLAARLLGAAGTAWTGELDDYVATMPAEVRGMLRSRANTIEGGTTEVNKNIIAERVLGLPKEPDPWEGRPWREVPRN